MKALTFHPFDGSFGSFKDSKYYKFHKKAGHVIGQCFQLHNLLEYMVRRRHLCQYIKSLTLALVRPVPSPINPQLPLSVINKHQNDHALWALIKYPLVLGSLQSLNGWIILTEAFLYRISTPLMPTMRWWFFQGDAHYKSMSSTKGWCRPWGDADHTSMSPDIDFGQVMITTHKGPWRN